MEKSIHVRLHLVIFSALFNCTKIIGSHSDYVGLKRIIKALAAEKELNEQDESPFSSSQDPELVGSSEGSNFYETVGSHGQSSFAFEGGSRMRFGSGEGASNATINATEDQPMLSRHPSSSGLPTTGSGSLPRPIPNRAVCLLLSFLYLLDLQRCNSIRITIQD